MNQEQKTREQVVWFAKQMEARLLENDYKGGWDEESFDYLTNRLEEECQELYTVAAKLAMWFIEMPSGASVARVIDEASDVANFAMMIADRARKMI